MAYQHFHFRSRHQTLLEGDGSGSLISELGDMQPDGGYTHQRMGSHPQDQLAGGAGDTTN